MKVSEQAAKTSVPGILQVRHFTDGAGLLGADVIWDELTGLPPAAVMVDPVDHTRRRELPDTSRGEDLLVPVFRRGKLVYRPPLAEVRERAGRELARLHPGLKRFVNPQRYPVGLERGLFDLRTRLVLEARGAPS